MPRLVLLLLAIWVGVSPALEGRAQDGPHPVWEGRVQFGDDPAWAAPDYNDHDWPTRRLYLAPDTTGIHWIRVPVALGETAAQALPARVELAVLAASEVYWDGVRIGSNGRVGRTPAEEVQGTIHATFHIPDSLYTPGKHAIALRLSNHAMPRDFSYYLYSLNVGPYKTCTLQARTLLPLLFVGGFLFIVVYCGILFILNPKRRALGMLALFCLVVSLLIGAESLRALVNYTYGWHAVRVHAITGLTAAVGLLLLAFVAEQFDAPHQGTVLAGSGLAFAALAAFVPGADYAVMGMYVIALGGALAIAGWAAWRGRRGGWMAVGGLTIGFLVLVGTGFGFASSYFSPAFAALVVGLLATLAVQAHRDTERRRTAQLRETRLELELLKRQIQPHFLMNTITAAMEWIEAEPAEGSRFLGALAAVLRRLGEMSGKRLVRVRQELDLCRSYLEVMSYRVDAALTLDTRGVDPEAWMPPAILHTLLENGLTHNSYPAGHAAVFVLAEERLENPDRRRYTLTTPPGTSAPPNTSPTNGAARNEGTGLRYVRTRLEEVAPGAWTLRSTPDAGGGWTTVIEVPADLSPAPVNPTSSAH
ncbi:MAG: hypothetical protein GVY25_12010 [Bacteroidetes bacterium]|jgi:hypothetical protein|nr:hypothetical protein [Bacteroidota bacterium]